jgi:C-terminal processing protease CtpA/Prc
VEIVARLQRRVVAWTALILIATAIAAAPGAHAEVLPDRNERVLGLARVWAKVKFFHPFLAYKDIDWDAALVAAIPRVEAATSLADYRAAVQAMLAVLGDPVTRIEEAVAPVEAPPVADWLTTPASGVVLVKLVGFVAGSPDFVGDRARGQQVLGEAAKARVLVIDLRVPHGQAERAAFVVETFLGDALPAIDEWPLERSIEHRGFRTQDGRTSGGYFSTFLTTGARPARPGPSPGVSHVVVIADADSALPTAALALQAAGRATIVARGALREDSVVSTTSVELPGQLVARVRLGELLWGPPAADVTVARDQEIDARALAIAKTARAGKPRAKPRKLVALPGFRPRNDDDYADAPYPSRERRLLAGIRLWAVLDSFFPYRYLIADWDAVLRDSLPRLADAADVDAYRRALREMAVRAGDGHINVWSPSAMATARPRGAPPVAVRLVEGKLAVTQLIDPAEAARAGVALGDVIETIDGKPAGDAIAGKRAEVSGSTDDARDQRIAAGVLAADDGSSAALGVRRPDGKLRSVTVARTEANLKAQWVHPPGPHWKKLAGNIGYVDLRTLLVPEVGPMFEDLKASRAIVFDMRGYPNGTAWSIAPRVNTRRARYGAQFLEPLVTGASGEGADSRIRFLQRIPELPHDAAIYSGKVIVLIDDRAISQAEHTCLFLAETAGATFIGSPTHGANGDVTVMRLPGGLRMSFTGQEVRHVDGRQLQKVGIQPDVLVRPTLAGLRAGKDEVLDRALAYLAAQR